MKNKQRTGQNISSASQGTQLQLPFQNQYHTPYYNQRFNDEPKGPVKYPLISKSNANQPEPTYFIEIPEHVEKIIRIFCGASPRNEWSGVLFYKVIGDFDSTEFRIVCEDILLMDIGSGTFTEYKFDCAAIGDYMAEHPELLECYTGLVHSHQNFNTFFSGTDTNTLQQEGSDLNNFVSLIVNNAGEYTAAITRKVTYKDEITTRSSGTYPFYSEKVVNTEVSESTTSKERTVVEWFYLNVIRHSVDENSYVTRFNAIREEKGILGYTPRQSVVKTNVYGNTTPYYRGFENLDEENLYTQNGFLAEQTVVQEDIQEDDEISVLAKLCPVNKKKLNTLMLKLLMGTPIADMITQAEYSTELGNKLIKKWESVFPEGKDFEIYFLDYVDSLIARGDCSEYFNKADLDKNNVSYVDVEALLSKCVLDECNKLNKNEYSETLCSVVADYCRPVF